MSPLALMVGGGLAPSGISTRTYLYLPGVAGNYASIADASSFNGLTDMTIDVAREGSWRPSAVTVLASQESANPNLSWVFRLFTDGTLGLRVCNNGVNVTGFVSTAAVPDDGAKRWIKARRVTGSAVIRFFTSPDGATYTQLGADVTDTTAASGALFASTADFEVGTEFGGTVVGSAVTGKVYGVRLWKDATETTKAVDIDFTRGPLGAIALTDSAQTLPVVIHTSGADPARIVAA